LPGETKVLTIEAASADLDGDAPLLAVDGWNVTVDSASAAGSPVPVTANVEAQPNGSSAPTFREVMP
jgi:hypothetical protein